jgi:hypothetical protein
MSIIKKPTQKSATETASQFGGGVAGAMLSRGVLSVIHDDATNPASGLNTTKLIKQLGLAALGIAGSMYINSTDVLSNMAKGALQGMAIMQGIDAVTTYTASTTAATTLVSSVKKTDKFMAKSLGLACPGDMAYGMGRPRRGAAMRSPFVEIPMEVTADFGGQSEVKTLDAFFQSKRAM